MCSVWRHGSSSCWHLFFWPFFLYFALIFLYFFDVATRWCVRSASCCLRDNACLIHDKSTRRLYNSWPWLSFIYSLQGCLLYGTDKSGFKHFHVFTLWGFIASKTMGQGILKGLAVGLVCFPSWICLWHYGWASIHEASNSNIMATCDSLIDTTCIGSWLLRRAISDKVSTMLAMWWPAASGALQGARMGWCALKSPLLISKSCAAVAQTWVMPDLL